MHVAKSWSKKRSFLASPTNMSYCMISCDVRPPAGVTYIQVVLKVDLSNGPPSPGSIIIQMSIARPEMSCRTPLDQVEEEALVCEGLPVGSFEPHTENVCQLEHAEKYKSVFNCQRVILRHMNDTSEISDIREKAVHETISSLEMIEFRD